jgi:hypothetical protein
MSPAYFTIYLPWNDYNTFCAFAVSELYPRCGADACNALQPAAFEGSDKFGNLTFTLQLSANSGLLPFGQSQSWAVGNATLALLLPVIGESPPVPLHVKTCQAQHSGPDWQ